MSIKITNTAKLEFVPSINMLVYGQPGVGKTTFAAKSKNVLIADVESGTNMLGLQGIAVDTVRIETWEDLVELHKEFKDGTIKYDTLVIDPLGELLDKLLTHLKKNGFASAKGNALSLQGWGVAKDKFRTMLRAFRDLNVHIICVAHTTEVKKEDNLLIRPKLQARLDEDVCAMMDIVAYLSSVKTDKKTVRRSHFEPSSEFYAKDRSSLLPKHIDNATFDTVKDTVLSSGYIKVRKHNEKTMDDFSDELDEANKQSK